MQRRGNAGRLSARQEYRACARCAARQFLGEFHALRLTTRKCRCLLADLDIAEANLHQRFKLVTHGWNCGEELSAFLNRHVENIGNRLAFELHFQRFAVVALAVTDITGDIDIRQEVHLNLDDAIALAGLTASTFTLNEKRPG